MPDMNTERVMQLLLKANAYVRESHVVYASGMHGSEYANKDALYLYPRYTSEICRMIALQFDNLGVEVVASPEKGGIILSQWVTYHLQKWNNSRTYGPEILSTYAEKVGKGKDISFVFNRGYDKIIRGKRVLVVEDILTTGGSVLKTVEAVRKIDGEVIGVGAILNRGKVTAAQVGDVPKLAYAAAVDMKAYDAKDCPLCLAKVPINTAVGHGREFLEKLKAA